MTVEDPSNSPFWLTTPSQQLHKEVEVHYSDMYMCMMGGQRPTWTRIAASLPAIAELDVSCDKSHSHLPWGRTVDADGREIIVATSLEAEYPRPFCISLSAMCHSAT